MRQLDLDARLVFTLTTAVVTGGGLDDQADVAAVTSLLGQAAAAESDVATTARGSAYEPAARALADDLESLGHLDAVRAALATGTIDLPGLLAAAEVPADRGWPGFLARVETTLTG